MKELRGFTPIRMLEYWNIGLMGVVNPVVTVDTL
jgi:hypothetical protein